MKSSMGRSIDSKRTYIPTACPTRPWDITIKWEAACLMALYDLLYCCMPCIVGGATVSTGVVCHAWLDICWDAGVVLCFREMVATHLPLLRGRGRAPHIRGNVGDLGRESGPMCVCDWPGKGHGDRRGREMRDRIFPRMLWALHACVALSCEWLRLSVSGHV